MPAAAVSLTINGVGETTLLAEAPQAPWPHSVALRAGGPPVELRLGIRPARCDPHAVAEDKVGTLLPLRVSVAGREGVLKIDAGDTTSRTHLRICYNGVRSPVVCGHVL